MTTPQQQQQPIKYPNQPDEEHTREDTSADLPPPLTKDRPDQASPATQDPTGREDIPIET
ncbi:MAG: hypothetical protein EOO32_02955 [Comamonadaceae bacterium]|nr:MAG: hypothetical protein EOO32_02955 [Comamonadaceae bacterium]